MKFGDPTDVLVGIYVNAVYAFPLTVNHILVECPDLQLMQDIR